ERLGWELAGLRCLVQGFGKVGGVAALELVEKGATVIGVADYSGGIVADDGLDLAALQQWVAEHGSVQGFAGARSVTNAELLEQPCDVLVLAALEGQLTAQNAPRIQARMVAEGANGPTTVEADAVLADRGIP